MPSFSTHTLGALLVAAPLTLSALTCEKWRARHFSLEELATPAVSGQAVAPDGSRWANPFEYFRLIALLTPDAKTKPLFPEQPGDRNLERLGEGFDFVIPQESFAVFDAGDRWPVHVDAQPGQTPRQIELADFRFQRQSRLPDAGTKDIRSALACATFQGWCRIDTETLFAPSFGGVSL